MSHALRVYELPMHHADLFDRLLVAQAQLESYKVRRNPEIWSGNDLVENVHSPILLALPK